MGSPDIKEELEPAIPVRILHYKELCRRFLDLGIVLSHNGGWVDFFRLAKRGPVHPSYAELFRAMPEPALKALALAFASGRITQLDMFKAFTTGNPPPDIFIPVNASP